MFWVKLNGGGIPSMVFGVYSSLNGKRHTLHHYYYCGSIVESIVQYSSASTWMVVNYMHSSVLYYAVVISSTLFPDTGVAMAV